jgi:hypothetical protein
VEACARSPLGRSCSRTSSSRTRKDSLAEGTRRGERFDHENILINSLFIQLEEQNRQYIARIEQNRAKSKAKDQESKTLLDRFEQACSSPYQSSPFLTSKPRSVKLSTLWIVKSYNSGCWQQTRLLQRGRIRGCSLAFVLLPLPPSSCFVYCLYSILRFIYLLLFYYTGNQ